MEALLLLPSQAQQPRPSSLRQRSRPNPEAMGAGVTPGANPDGSGTRARSSGSPRGEVTRIVSPRSIGAGSPSAAVRIAVARGPTLGISTCQQVSAQPGARTNPDPQN